MVVPYLSRLSSCYFYFIPSKGMCNKVLFLVIPVLKKGESVLLYCPSTSDLFIILTWISLFFPVLNLYASFTSQL